MATPRVYVDFQNLDDQNRLRLTCAGTRGDWERQGIELREGMTLTLYTDDANDEGHSDKLLADGVVHYDDGEKCWVAAIDWKAIRREWDPTMELARRTAERFGPAPQLPASLQGSTPREANIRRTELLKEIENLLDREIRSVQGSVLDAYQLEPQIPLLTQRLLLSSEIDQITRGYLPDVPDLSARINIALRLWAGYIDGAKVIGPRTRDEDNTAETRQRDIRVIEAKVAKDPIYAAGVEAAPHYKWRVLHQDIYRDGVPVGSIVLRDWDD